MLCKQLLQKLEQYTETQHSKFNGSVVLAFFHNLLEPVHVAQCNPHAHIHTFQPTPVLIFKTQIRIGKLTQKLHCLHFFSVLAQKNIETFPPFHFNFFSKLISFEIARTTCYCALKSNGELSISVNMSLIHLQDNTG